MKEQSQGSGATDESKQKQAVTKAKSLQIGDVSVASADGEKKESTTELVGGNFIFPCGYVDNDGKVLKTFTVAPLTGYVRKRIAEPQIRNNGGKIITVLLKECLKSIEGLERITVDDVCSLTASDRDFACLMIRKISLGKELTLHAVCPSCDTKLDIDIDIDEMEVRKFNPSFISLENRDYVVKINSEELNINAKLRLPNGFDQEKISPLIKNNPIAGSLKLLERCLIEYNGKNNIGSGFLENLPVNKLDFIDFELGKIIPGVDLTPIIKCDTCDTKLSANIDVADFLFKRLVKNV